MKLLYAFIAMIVSSSAAIADDGIVLKKVYQVPGASAEMIEQSFGDRSMKHKATGLDTFQQTLNVGAGKTQNLEMDKAKGSFFCKAGWGVQMGFDGTVILQAKEGRYRLIVRDLINSESRRDFMKHNPKFIKKCKAQIEAWADEKHKAVTSLASDDF